ncbi:uncharacterized protein TRIADDRAFT_9900, partial [Trichoplax adhaerens]
VYLDDIVVYDTTWEDHLRHLKTVFQILEAANLTLQPAKCTFAKGTVTYLGHQIGSGVVQPKKLKMETIERFPQPKTKREVRAFLGLTGYYRRFIPNYVMITDPLTRLICK